jgi:hypothetical protein
MASRASLKFVGRSGRLKRTSSTLSIAFNELGKKSFYFSFCVHRNAAQERNAAQQNAFIAVGGRLTTHG